MIVGLIIGLFPGFGIGIVYKLIKDRRGKKNMERSFNELVAVRNKLAQELSDTKALLRDSLSAMEVLNKYKT